MRKRMIRRNGVAQKLGPVHPATVWRYTKDPTFPVAYQIGPNVVAWDEDEIDAWLETRRKVRPEADNACTGLKPTTA